MHRTPVHFRSSFSPNDVRGFLGYGGFKCASCNERKQAEMRGVRLRPIDKGRHFPRAYRTLGTRRRTKISQRMRAATKSKIMRQKYNLSKKRDEKKRLSAGFSARIKSRKLPAELATYCYLPQSSRRNMIRCMKRLVHPVTLPRLL